MSGAWRSHAAGVSTTLDNVHKTPEHIKNTPQRLAMVCPYYQWQDIVGDIIYLVSEAAWVERSLAMRPERPPHLTMYTKLHNRFKLHHKD